MSALQIELRPQANGELIDVEILGGFSANRRILGRLHLRVGEFQLLAVTLSMGAEQTHGMVKFEMDREAERKALAEADA